MCCLVYIVPFLFTFASRMTFSSRMLKSSHDKLSPCLNPRSVLKGSERSFPTLTADVVPVKVILHSRINFAGMPNADMALYTSERIRLSNAALYSTNGWNVSICFSKVFSKNLAQSENLVDGEFARSEAALVWFKNVIGFSRSHSTLDSTLYAMGRRLIPL